MEKISLKNRKKFVGKIEKNFLKNRKKFFEKSKKISR